MKRICATCKWRSDSFTSACTNGDSPRRADFVSADDTCDEWDGMPINQYCIYCASCVEVDGKLYCDKKETDLTECQSKRINHCPHFFLSPLGHVLTGKPYRPQRWKYMRAYSNFK